MSTLPPSARLGYRWLDADGAATCGALIQAIDPVHRPQRFARLAQAAEIAALLLADPPAGRAVIVFSQFIDDQAIGFVVLDRATGEIEYCVGSRHWRRGFASEALGTLLPLLRAASKTGRLYARTARENVASLGLLEKCAFRFAGLDRDDRGGTLARFVGPARPDRPDRDPCVRSSDRPLPGDQFGAADVASGSIAAAHPLPRE